MKHTMFVFAFILLITTGLAQNTHSSKAAKHVETADVKAQYTCPMHPEVVSDKPGKCPKCGMKLVLAMNEVDGQPAHDEHSHEGMDSAAKAKINQARALLGEAKQELAQDGKYNCCIKDPCDRCVLDHQSCPCGDEVKKGKGVCPDCYAGWQRGDGTVKGVKASSVKGSFHSHSHKH